MVLKPLMYSPVQLSCSAYTVVLLVADVFFIIYFYMYDENAHMC